MSETLKLRPKLSVEYIKTLPFRYNKDLDFFVNSYEKAGLPRYPLAKKPEKPSIHIPTKKE